jgi:3-deoxy-7-phosphoheptulonate synthase
MWISLEVDADPAEVQRSLQSKGLWTSVMKGSKGVGLSVAPHSKSVPIEDIVGLEGVSDVCVAKGATPLVEAQRGRAVRAADMWLGLDRPVLLAGPCSVESESQIHSAAAMVAKVGGTFLRGGAFKPRTSPYAFTGAGSQGLVWLREAADAHGLGVVSEVLGEGDLDGVAKVADLLQIGSRNMQNFALLRAVGQVARPVLLKRGMGATLSEWLQAAEHLLASGSGPVVFCERGIRSFDNSTRNVLDLGAVALLVHVHKQIVVVDPSHATGRRDLLRPLSRAAMAAGAAGLLLEAHPCPSQARSDGPQALHREELVDIADDMGLDRYRVTNQRATG